MKYRSISCIGVYCIGATHVYTTDSMRLPDDMI